MIWAILSGIIVFLVAVYAEHLSRHKGVHVELTRKLVHISVGTFAAFWPFFLSWRQIQFLALGALIAVCLSLKFNVFGGVHSVHRASTGEVLAVITVGMLAFLLTSPWTFAAAMLTLSLGDGLAAIIGLLWGDDNKYKVFGHTKSIAGSLAFFLTTLVIMICYAAFSHEPYTAVTIVWLPVLATVAENMSVRGVDNIVLPLLVAFVLSSSL